MSSVYRVAVFAHNEERGIEATLQCILANVPSSADLKVFVLINGCTDRTAECVDNFRKRHPVIIPVHILHGDKCLAWNVYVHHYADASPCHFFMDGDVECSPNAFELMQTDLLAHENATATAIAGMPMSGRNMALYRRCIERWRLVFGNLYGVKGSHLESLRKARLFLPLGLSCNDHIVTRFMWASRPELSELDNRQVIFDRDAGYVFHSLQPYRLRDWKTYFNRMVRYRLGDFQRPEINNVPLRQLPATLDAINKSILSRLESARLCGPINAAVRRWLRKQYPSAESTFYDNYLQSNQPRPARTHASPK